MTPAFCAPPSMVGDKFLFCPMAFIVFIAPYIGMSGDPMAVVPALMPGVLGWLMPK